MQRNVMLINLWVIHFHISTTHCIVFCHGLHHCGPTKNKSSAMPNAFDNSLNISSIFLWNMPAAMAAPNGRLLYLYMPHRKENVAKYDHFSSSFR